MKSPISNKENSLKSIRYKFINIKKGFWYWTYFYFLSYIVVYKSKQLSKPSFFSLVLVSLFIHLKSYQIRYNQIKTEYIDTLLFDKYILYAYNSECISNYKYI